MRIHIDDLKPDKRLEISGDEEWLSKIYGDFPAPDGEVVPRLVGNLHVVREEAGTVLVRGSFDYAPFVSCSRCDKPIPWPVHADVDVRFFSPPPGHLEVREKTLTSSELDEYWIERDEVDLEGLINDAVQTSLPSRLLAVTDDGSACRICLADLTDDRVWSAGSVNEEEERESPFSVLSKLKH